VLIMRPYIDYPRTLMPLIESRYGLRTVALYTDPVALHKNFRRAPEIVGPYVSASYLAHEDDLDEVVEVLRRRHQIVACVPSGEADVLPIARIATALGIEGTDLETRERFRDKAALKDFLRSVPDGPRINISRLVRSLDDVRTVMEEHELDRAVLKPNAGVSNRDVLFVDRTTADDVLARYFGGLDVDVLLEEYIGGREFFVNGQVDERGVVHVFTVNEYVHRALNGRPNVSTGHFTVRTSLPEFEVAATYARDVIRATGLRRSPFHLELKIDDVGPCLIEVGARFCGANIAMRDSDAHGGLDVLGIGAHHFISAEPYGDYALDWAAYDDRVRGLVSGIATRDQRIASLSGVAETERMPEFVRWDNKPEFGAHVVPTVDFASVPWRATVSCESEEHFHSTSERVRALVRIDAPQARPWSRLRELAAYVPPVFDRAYGQVAARRHVERIGASS
jgi:hypothetical protein